VNNPFFKNVGPFKITEILKHINADKIYNIHDDLVFDIKDLQTSKKSQMTFFHSKKYSLQASRTNATYCITLENLVNYLPEQCIPICVDNVLLATSQVTSLFYPDATIIENDVAILDGCIIGKKGFGFFPNNQRNLRYPHIGIVLIGENSEIGCGATIDRGSMSNTIIGKNTFLDNQIHIAHNNKIGDNCIIAGQVGFAGSSTLGNNVMIGGQAGISGHLKVGNNVQIGGGSGVIKDIPDNSKVMGYPSKDLRQFLKDNK
jgi:UDP-3-O-[3-hydroxymyristoyl] glucosamine N-acyltransferase